MRLNGIGFDISQPIKSYLHPAARQLCTQTGLPFSAMLAGPHGEFELIFTIPREKEPAFLKQAKTINWQPVLLGTSKAVQTLRIKSKTKTIQPDTPFILNLFEQNRGRVESYIHQLIGYLNSL
jgi:thiamine-monophosphate kinase